MDMKKKYGELLYQHHILMEDWGYVLPEAAVEQVFGWTLPPEQVLATILEHCEPYTNGNEPGFQWRGFFWSGELKLNKYMLKL